VSYPFLLTRENPLNASLDKDLLSFFKENSLWQNLQPVKDKFSQVNPLHNQFQKISILGGIY
jgi:hypothetical protein